MPLQTDFAVVIEDRPGTAAVVAEALGGAGVNIEGVCGVVSGGEGILHVLIDTDPSSARDALSAAGVSIRDERPVWVAACHDRPGELGRLLRRLADADVNCDLLYMTVQGRVVIGAEDHTQAATLLH